MNPENSFELQAIREEIFPKLRAVYSESAIPEFEIESQLQYVSEIRRLKKEKNAIVLGHNYMDPLLYMTVPDFRGDSLELSRRAATTNADFIVFCGVKFMAETAKILNPSKKVLIPSLEAGCSLAEGITAQDVRWLKEKFPGLPVVTYINTYADVKAETDVCCTSGNVMAVVEWAKKQWDSKSIIFLPDKYMAGNIAKENGMQTFYPTKDMENPGELVDYKNTPTIIGWNARCYVHEQYRPEHVRQIVNAHPDALIIAHPEVPPDTMAEVLKVGGRSGSTSEMVQLVENSKRGQLIATMTECSLADNVLSRRPDLGDRLLRMCNQRCKYMKTITLQDTYEALKNEQFQVEVDPEIAEKAKQSVKRMIEIG